MMGTSDDTSLLCAAIGAGRTGKTHPYFDIAEPFCVPRYTEGSRCREGANAARVGRGFFAKGSYDVGRTLDAGLWTHRVRHGLWGGRKRE